MGSPFRIVPIDSWLLKNTKSKRTMRDEKVPEGFLKEETVYN